MGFELVRREDGGKDLQGEEWKRGRACEEWMPDQLGMRMDKGFR